MPINNGSSILPNTTNQTQPDTAIPIINCSSSNLPSTTNFTSLLAGLKVLQKYSIYQYMNDLSGLLLTLGYPPVCKDAVQYRNAITIGLTPTANNIAKWYTVLNSYKQYIEYLQNIKSMEYFNTTIALITAINDDFFNILQDINCNCSNDCIINEPSYDTVSDSCTLPLLHVHYLFGSSILRQIIYTINEYKNICLCTGPNDINNTLDPASEWFSLNFPSDDPEIDEIRKFILP